MSERPTVSVSLAAQRLCRDFGPRFQFVSTRHIYVVAVIRQLDCARSLASVPFRSKPFGCTFAGAQPGASSSMN
jgi:hypothetical protein